jgi:hypothetical protein
VTILYFNQINPFYYSLFLCPFTLPSHYSTAFSVFCYAIFIYRCKLFQYYSLYHSLFLSFLPSPLK